MARGRVVYGICFVPKMITRRRILNDETDPYDVAIHSLFMCTLQVFLHVSEHGDSVNIGFVCSIRMSHVNEFSVVLPHGAYVRLCITKYCRARKYFGSTICCQCLSHVSIYPCWSRGCSPVCFRSLWFFPSFYWRSFCGMKLRHDRKVSGVEYDRAGVAAHAKNLANKVKGGLEVCVKYPKLRNILDRACLRILCCVFGILFQFGEKSCIGSNTTPAQCWALSSKVFSSATGVLHLLKWWKYSSYLSGWKKKRSSF